MSSVKPWKGYDSLKAVRLDWGERRIGQPTPCLPGSASTGPWAYTRERLQQQNTALPPQPLQQQFGGTTSSIGVPSAPSYGSASAAGAAYPAFASPSPCTPASALPQAQPFAHGFPKATPADDFSLKRRSQLCPSSKLKGETLQASLKSLMSGCRRLLFLSTLGLLQQCNSGSMQLLQPELLTNNGLTWLLHKELQTSLPSTGHALPLQLSALEATVRADLCNLCLPEKVQCLAIQKSATTVADLLYLAFLTFLPSEPSARVDGLAEIEAAVKPSRTFAEALAFLRAWRQKIVTAVNDLSGNPEPLKLLGSLRSLISSLVASDTVFASEVSQIYRQTNVKTMMLVCGPPWIFLRSSSLPELKRMRRKRGNKRVLKLQLLHLPLLRKAMGKASPPGSLFAEIFSLIKAVPEVDNALFNILRR